MYFIVMAALAQGADVPAVPPGPIPRLETVQVTAVASRVPQSIDATPSTVTVTTREDLDRALARDIRDALRYEPGLAVEYGAARFGLGNIAIRGLEGNRVQMLQDGIRMPEGFRIGSFSNASRNPYDIALLSRLEVLRGPGSALYGSDALAGVLSMTTLDPADVVAKGRGGGFAQVGYASADEGFQGTAVGAVRTARAELLLGASRIDGHERDNRGEVDIVGGARTRPNPQDGRAESWLAKLLVPTSQGGRVRATFDRFERGVATDVLSLNPQSPRTVSLDGDDHAERERFSVDGVHYGVGPFDRLSWLAWRQRSRTRQDTREVRVGTTAQCLSAPGGITCRREARFTFEQDEVGLTAIAQRELGRHQLIAGAEWSRSEADEMRDGQQHNLTAGTVSNVVGTDVFPVRDFPRSRVERSGIFVQDDLALGPVTLVPALRYDRFGMRPEVDSVYAADNPGASPVSITDSAWSPKLGLLWPLTRSTTITLQAATGFRAPPYYDANVGLSNLPLGFTVIPNPDLRPETSRGLEAGVRGAHGAFDYSVTAFRTDYDDLIVSRSPLPCPGDPRCVPGSPITFQSQNVTSARIEGVEVRMSARLPSGFSARAGAAWARGDDRSRGVPLNSVDPAKVVAGLAWESGGRGAEFVVSHAWAKARIDASGGALFATPAWTVADLTAFVKVGRHLSLHGGVFNLFDEKYWLWSDVRGVPNQLAVVDRYSQPGRNFAVRARLEF